MGKSTERAAKRVKAVQAHSPTKQAEGSSRPGLISEQPSPAESITPVESKGILKETEPFGLAKVPSKQKRAKEELPPLPAVFKVIAGSYEKLLYGLEGTTSFSSDLKLEYNLKPIFIFPAHVSCIKAVAASPNGGKWLATGSADEIIKVWDLRRKKEIGGLMQHQGSITHLSFPSRSHLLSASEDGTLCLFRARDWAILRSLKGHKGRVNSVAVHPSGKVALSVGKDKTLRMWDFMRGSGCASTKLGKEGEVVRWSTDGSMLVVQSGSTIDVYNTDMVLLHAIRHPSRLHDVKFCNRIDGNGEVLLVGAEDRKVSVYEISSDQDKVSKIIAEFVGHGNRIKAIQILEIALPEASARKSTIIVCTVSSDGNIHIYDMIALPATPSKEICQIYPVTQYDSKGTRLTCVTLADGGIQESTILNGKRKRADSEGINEKGPDMEEPDDAFGLGWEDEVEEGESESD